MLLQTNWTLFFGRFHPFLVHLPVALILAAGLMEWLCRKRGLQMLQPALRYLWLWAAISGIAAAIAGWLIAYDTGYASTTLFLHRWSGIGVALLASLIWWIGKKEKKQQTTIYKALIISVVALVLWAGHLGGELSRGPNFLWQYAPAPLAGLFGIQYDAEPLDLSALPKESVVVYTHIIQPLLNQKCTRCHGEEVIKGEVQLHSKAAIQESSEKHELLLPGNPSESELFETITLPFGDSHYMPADGKNPMSYEEIRLIEWWIRSGASFDAPLTSLPLTEDIKAILQESFQLNW